MYCTYVVLSTYVLYMYVVLSTYVLYMYVVLSTYVLYICSPVNLRMYCTCT